VADPRRLTLGVLVPIAVLAMTGVAGGAIWVWWADPPARADATASNLALLVATSSRWTAAMRSWEWCSVSSPGTALAVRLRSVGWPLVVGVSLGGAAAAAVSYGVGMLWGPEPSPGTERGAWLSGGMSVHAPGVYLTWPVERRARTARRRLAHRPRRGPAGEENVTELSHSP
jgi:hypothetical protein